MKKRLKNENGSAMILALLFLLFCSLVGGALLTSAWVGAGRAGETSAAQEDFLACRSALSVLRRDFADQPQLTIRDVTVRENKISTRTVTYTLQNCGAGLLAEYLLGYVVTKYELDTGTPDGRILQNFPFALRTETEAAKEILIKVSENRELTGLCTVSKDSSFHIRLQSGVAELVLDVDAVTGKSDTVRLTAGGVRTTTKTTVIRWSDGTIRKGGTP